MTERDQFDLHHDSRMNMRLNAVTRTAVCALGLILQIGLTFLITWRLRQHAAYLYTAFELLGIVAAILMVNQEKNASYTVSYTHLDVYKRQVVYFQSWESKYSLTRLYSKSTCAMRTPPQKFFHYNYSIEMREMSKRPDRRGGACGTETCLLAINL